MTLYLGAASVNSSTGVVELRSPLGFGGTRGVRLSNFTADSLILNNIHGIDQSQERLSPQTQMVYPSINVGAIPTVTGVTLTAAEVAASLQVEWSDDPAEDFLGTYPAALPASPVPVAGTTFIGALNTGEAQTFAIDPLVRSLVVIVKNLGTGGGVFSLSFKSGTQQGPVISLDGTGAGNDTPGESQNEIYVLIPVLGTSVTISGFATTVGSIWGSEAPVSQVTSIPSVPIYRCVVTDAGGTSFLGNAGGGRVRLFINLADPTMEGHMNLQRGLVNILDTTEMVTLSDGSLGGSVELVLPPGLNPITWTTVTAGGSSSDVVFTCVSASSD